MLEGRIIHECEVKGHRVVFRYPRWSDLPQFLQMRREFHKDQVMANAEKTDRAVACKRLSEILTSMEVGRSRHLFVDLDGKLSGEGSIAVHSAKLYATIGLSLMRRARGTGIGRKMMTLLENEARKCTRYRLYLNVWAKNPHAVHLYKKLGYKETGRRRDWNRMRDGKSYSDLVDMVKTIK